MVRDQNSTSFTYLELLTLPCWFIAFVTTSYPATYSGRINAPYCGYQCIKRVALLRSNHLSWFRHNSWFRRNSFFRSQVCWRCQNVCFCLQMCVCCRQFLCRFHYMYFSRKFCTKIVCIAWARNTASWQTICCLFCKKILRRRFLRCCGLHRIKCLFA